MYSARVGRWRLSRRRHRRDDGETSERHVHAARSRPSPRRGHARCWWLRAPGNTRAEHRAWIEELQNSIRDEGRQRHDDRAGMLFHRRFARQGSRRRIRHQAIFCCRSRERVSIDGWRTIRR